MSETTITVQLPPRFYDDHVDRDLPGGTVVKRTKRLVTVEATEAELAEILSDARYYSEPGGPGDYDLGIKSSAQATVRRINAASAR